MRVQRSIPWLGILLLLPHARAEESSQRILSLNPIGEHACVAVPLSHEAGQVLTGVRWLHNDDSVNFPRLLLLERQANEPPDLADVGLILYDLGGEQLSWGEASLELPVTSSTERIWAVFVFPANALSTGLGQGGGPGIGLRAGAGEDPFYLSADGLSWVRFDAGYVLEVEAEVGSAQKTGPTAVLEDLASELDYWTQVEAEHAAKPVTRTQLLPAHPNPFNPRTVLSFELVRAGGVRLDVYDIRGRHVISLADRFYPAGRYRRIWEGIDANGRAVASGVYLVVMKSPGHIQEQKVVLLR